MTERRAYLVLAAVTVLLSVAAMLYAVNYANSTRAAIEHQAAATQAAQARQGAAVERKLCTTLGRLAALAPPPGSPDANPSRGYLQDLHATLAELGPDLGCGR